ALGISALLPASPTVEAGPDPCPPDDPAVFFYDCFDLGDMNGQDEALPGDSSDNVDSDNYDNQWDEVEGASQDCKINFEELLLSSVGTIGFGCSAVTSPVVTVSGYSEVTVSFAWGGQGAVLVPPPSLSVYLDQGSGFTQIGEALILPLPSTCDSVGLIGLVTCADFDANIPVTLADCGEHQLRLRFNGPAFVGGVSLLAYVDDVRIVGTSQEGCDAAGDDDPALPNINVTKVCVGGSPSATFAISIGSQTEN